MKDMTLDLEKIQQMLEEQQEKLLKQLNRNKDGSRRPNNPDRSDLAARYEQNQRKVLLWARAEQQLEEVENALARIENGTYGKCESCGNQIHQERLETLPATSLCMDCRNLP